MLLKINRYKILCLISIIIFLMVATVSYGADLDNLTGRWEGKINIGGKKLDINVKFFEDSGSVDAVIDIPLQKIYDYSLENIDYNKDNIYFELPAQKLGKFSGRIGQTKIEGEYKQGDLEGHFQLEKNNFSKKQNKNQNNKNNNSYNTPPYPALIIVSDFGKPDDKTENLHKLLTDFFVKKGFEVFCYDNSRFDFARRTSNEMTFNKLVEDLVGYSKNIAKKDEINDVYIIGQNQGGLLGLAVAEKDDLPIKTVISLDGPLRPASEIILDQLTNLQNDLLAETNYIIKQLKKGKTVDKVSRELESLFSIKVQPFLISWFNYNPIKILDNLDIPILITGDSKIKPGDKIIFERENIEYVKIGFIYDYNDNKGEIALNEELKNKLGEFIDIN